MHSHRWCRVSWQRDLPHWWWIDDWSVHCGSGTADGLHNLVVTPSDGVAEGAVPFANVFQKVSAPTIFIVSPAFGLPGFGTIGAARAMVIEQFATLASARNCDLLSLFPARPALATTPATSCSISSAGTGTGTFAVSKTAVAGAYVVRVRDSGTGGTGWVADAPFAVSPLPVTATGPGFGAAGTGILVFAGGFPTPEDDGPCTIISNPTTRTLFSVQVCNIAGGATLFAGFVVSNTAPGSSCLGAQFGGARETSRPPYLSSLCQLSRST